jgi:hypothetical protein
MTNQYVDVVRDVLGNMAAVLMKVVNMIFMVIDKIVYVLDRSFNALMTQCFKNPIFIVVLLGIVLAVMQLESSFIHTLFGQDNKGVSSPDMGVIYTESITAWLLFMWILVLVISRL